MNNDLLLRLDALLQDEPIYEKARPILQQLIKDEGKFEERRSRFYYSLVEYLPQYGKQMIRQFYDYWSEGNRAPKPKMKWELEKTWELSKRLARWANNNFRQPIVKEDEIDLSNF